MKGDLGAYSTEEFKNRLATEIKIAIAPPNIAPTSTPRAILLGGQSGAGKTTLHQICKRKLDGNAIIINGDEFRSSHPRFQALHRAFGDKSVDNTAPWAGRMTEALIDSLSRIGYNLVSCQIRYEEMRVAGTTPRATDPAHHNKIIDQIVSNLGALETSGMFDEITLYDRSQTCLFPREGADDNAEEALRTILFGPWTPEERRHYNELKAKLNYLKTK